MDAAVEPSLPPLPPDLARRAEQELNEVPAERPERIRTFREAVLSVPGLKSRTDDAFLMKFLRVRKFDHKRALDMLTNYYKQRAKYPLLFKTMVTSSIPKFLECNIIEALPHRDALGRSIVLARCGTAWDPSILTLEDLTRVSLLTLELVIQDDEPQVNGGVFIVNLDGFGLKHIAAIGPSALYQTISVTLNSFPLRFKQIHYINNPAIFRIVFAMMKPLLNKKLKERIRFHGRDLSSLHEFFSPESLPEEFGGTWSATDHSKWNSEWKRRLTENDKEIVKDHEFGFSLAKRKTP